MVFKTKNLKLLTAHYSLLTIHILIVIYMAIIAYLSITGVLKNYRLWSNLNIVGLASMLGLQLKYRLQCVLTVWQNNIRKKLKMEKMKYFMTHYINKLFKRNLEKVVTAYNVMVYAIIFIYYLLS